jgi:anti-sigma regulatory factor (Ser/Thr protein kinase)
MSKPTTSVTLRLPAEPAAPERARESLRAVCAGLPWTVVEDATLLTSEIVTNSVKYAHGMLTVAIECAEDVVQVSVADESTSMPTLRRPGLDEAGGRGLQLVDRVATAWGCDRHVDGGGKTVWFRVAAP